MNGGGEGEGGGGRRWLGWRRFRGGEETGREGGGALSFSILGGGRRGLGGGGGGDWHWRLKGRGVWVVGLSFSRPFFGFLFHFLGFGVVNLRSQKIPQNFRSRLDRFVFLFPFPSQNSQ